ncbi:succinate dehydrogenase cytochrome b subunit [bacterium]|nr:succinate dehydrogenase cytochrome b subunit [bacterium]
MSEKTTLTSSSIGRKVVMALSALFLILFLLLHFSVNFTSIFSEDVFNVASEFMGTNWIVQFIMQPILILGVLVHFIMGFYLEIKNRSSRQVKYAQYNGASNSSWMSRNMIITGIVILLFLGLHFLDFWVPEMKYKYIEGGTDATRYYEELVHEFSNPWRVLVYCLSFVFLALHLLHGFQSSFQSMGWNHPKYTPIVKRLGDIYSIVIPLGFISIALFHFFISN